jgi:acyl transferase domain-containing protein/acyl carrier protein
MRCSTPSTSTQVAVIGMSGRFPDAPTLDAFWTNLANGVESIRRFSERELIESGEDAAAVRDPWYVRAGVLLDGIDLFDAGFFGMTPREAEITDPQQRLFLECCWEAMEDAGYDAAREPLRVGVFAGASMSNYLESLYRNQDILRAAGMYQILLNNDKDHLPTRVSYRLNLTGPSLCVQAACATSLVAVHLACRCLLDGECDMALAGGVTIGLLRKKGYLYQEGGILSPDGHCRAFDAGARGTVGGSGAGVLLLKPLARAIADGDAIRAVILGSAVNNDGAQKAGYMAPSEAGQAMVIRDALAMAGAAADSITYVEAHGTATIVGDPIEIAALTRAFATEKHGFCAIGSVKTNVGHTDAAAGVAGLIKTILALQHRQIPPSLHAVTPNPAIDLARSPFRINTHLTAWESEGALRAGVSSFGLGGTNAHVIVQEAPRREATDTVADVNAHGPHVLLLSARTETALAAVRGRLADYLERTADPLADVAFTLQQGRRRFPHRSMTVCRDRADAVRRLRAPASDQATVMEQRQGRALTFLFPGQGSHYERMGASLYRRYDVFRQCVDECSALLEPHLQADLGRALREPAGALGDVLPGTRLIQPLLFTVEYALARLWMYWGAAPAAMIGHSVGEFVAATVAGVFSLGDVLRLIAERASLIQRLPGGAMLAVHAGADQLASRLPVSAWLAASNGAKFSVAAGTEAAIAQLETELRADGVGCKRLTVSHAFHSGLMDPILDNLAAVLADIELQPPRLPIVSTVTGTWLTAEQATDRRYWVRHARETVRFREAMSTLLADDIQVFLEIGPDVALSTFVRQQAREQGGTITAESTMGRDPEDEVARLTSAVGRCWLAGVDLDWRKVSGGAGRVPLPTYPFERERYWVEPQKPTVAPDAARRPDPADWFAVPCWRPLPAATAAAPTSLATAPTWLLFAGRGETDDDFVREALAHGGTVIRVRPGERWSGPGPASDGRIIDCEVQPDLADDYVRLWSVLRGRGLAVTHVIHLWSRADAWRLAGGHEPAASEPDPYRPFFRLLALLQAIGREHGETPIDLTVVTRHLHRVDSGDTIDPLRALLLGPCRVAAQELPHVHCRTIDLEPQPASRESTAAVARAVLDCVIAGGPERTLALRGGGWWTQEWLPTRLDAPAASFTVARPQGVYLITGGLGAIGLAVAAQLASEAPVTLVLVSRSSVPSEEHWDAWIAEHGPEERTRRRLAKLQALRQAGATVIVRQADVSSLHEMRSLLADVEPQAGPICGIVHAAGVAGGGIVALKTREAATAVLAPKVRGTLVLHDLFKTRALDFFVLCSSLNAIYGGAGQADYCAANAFLDAYATARRDRAVIAINWSAWREEGMAADAVVPAQLRRRHQQELRDALSTAEGVDVLRRVLARPLAQVAVSPKDLRYWTGAQSARARAAAGTPSPAGIAAAADSVQRAAATSDHPGLNAFERKIAGLWQLLLGASGIGPQDDFFELGGHSLLATQVIAAVRREFAVELPLRSLFDAPTLAGFARLVYEKQVDETGEDVLLQLLAEVTSAQSSPAR